MFSYDSADITYAVTFGKLDGSSDIDYSVDLNQKEAKIYTKARMLGQNLNGLLDTDRIKREIVRFEKYEYDTDISHASVSISFCGNQEQPPVDDVKEYLRDLLASHRVTFAHEVVEAQINIFEDTDNDWNQIALDLAMEVDCPGYAKKYQEGKFNKSTWDKERKKLLKTVSKKRPVKKETKVKSTYVVNPWTYKPPIPEPEGDEKIRRHRGCKDITKPDDKQLHIITKSGKEVIIDAVPPFRLNFYGVGLCPFTIENDWFGSKNECPKGKWGFFNPEGEIVIEPQYFYACGPYGSHDDEYYLVCKNWYTDYAWGILDSHGKESLPCLPCKYIDLEQTTYGSTFNDVLIYVPYGEKFDIRGKRHGLIKRDGTVILEPQFFYISKYDFNWEHKLFKAGMSSSKYGVFSLEQNKFITPENCSHVIFNDETKTIECHYPLEGNFFAFGPRYEATYDYDGNLINKIKIG